MFGSFRNRIVLTVIALVVVTAAVVAVLSYVLVANSLERQLVDDATAQADFNIGVLASQDVLPTTADRTVFEASGLADRFRQRGSEGLYVEFDDSDDHFASGFSLLDAGRAIDSDLRRLVASGRLGYQFVGSGSETQLLVGGRRPSGGPDFYFFFSAAEIDAALAEMRRVLLLAGIGVTVVGALVAGLVARGVLRPVRNAATAARVVADGDLSVRLPVESRDEFGAWAESFNTMASSLQTKIGELQAARAREERFVADVSHELRTPLTALVGEAEMLRNHMDAMPPPARRASELLSADVARLRLLVADLLEISRLDASAAVAGTDEVAVAAFLQAEIDDRLPGAVLEADDRLVVECDRRALDRIVGNLLDNAAGHAPGSRVFVEAAQQEDMLTIRIADTGPGVPPEALPHLFDRFYSVDTARSGGTGLGLAIARAHVERMRGTLTVRHNEPHGLIFELRVPVSDLLHAGDSRATFTSHDEGETQKHEPGGPR
jgi:signal transduction histidine kinase